MVRYELILHRRPKIGAKEVEKRLGDLPKELSKGTLERALENLDGGSIAIAWGGSRKRLRSIQRRIEILGGATELVDHGGVFAKTLTSIGDELGYLFGAKRPEVKKRKPTKLRDPTALNYIFLIVSVVAAGFALIFARGVQDADARLYATLGSGFLLGVCMSQVFVRGVRRWFTEQGRAWISVGMMLVPFLSVSAAGYEAYALGIAQQSAAKLAKHTRLARPKPTMKPFTALMVELKRRKQREELAAALAATEIKPAGQQPTAAGSAESATTATAMISAETQQPVTPALEPAAPRVPESILWQPAEVAVRKPQPPRPQTLQEQLERWEPLRTIADVNELHVAAAALLALLTFAIGVWTGRRRTPGVVAAAAAEPASELQPTAAEAAPEATPTVQQASEPTPATEPDSPPQPAAPAAEVAAAPTPAAAPQAPPVAPQSEPAPAPAPVQLEPVPIAPEALPLPAAANENAETEPKPLAATGTDDRKPKRRREGAPGSAYSAHGSIQEEHVVPKRRDARRDE